MDFASKLKENLCCTDEHVVDGVIVRGVSEAEMQDASISLVEVASDVEVGQQQLVELETTALTLESILNSLENSVHKATPAQVGVVNANLYSLESRFNIRSGGLVVSYEDGSEDSATAEQTSKIKKLLTAIKDSVISVLSNITGALELLKQHVITVVTGVRTKALDVKKNINESNTGGHDIRLTPRSYKALNLGTELSGGTFIDNFKRTSDVLNAVVSGYKTSDGFEAFVKTLVTSMKDGKPDIKALKDFHKDLDKFNLSKAVYGTDGKMSGMGIEKSVPDREEIRAFYNECISIYLKATQDSGKEEPSLEDIAASMEGRIIDFAKGGLQVYIGGCILYYGLTKLSGPVLMSAKTALSTAIASGTISVVGALVPIFSVVGIALFVFVIGKMFLLKGSRNLVSALEDNNIEDGIVDFVQEVATKYTVVYTSEPKSDMITKALSSNEIQMTCDNIISLCDNIISMAKGITDRNKLANNLKPVFKELNKNTDKEARAIDKMVSDLIETKLNNHISFEKEILSNFASVLQASVEYVTVSNEG